MLPRCRWVLLLLVTCALALLPAAALSECLLPGFDSTLPVDPGTFVEARPPGDAVSPLFAGTLRYLERID